MRRSYLGLDLIRFAAAAMVMFYHLAYFVWLPRPGGRGDFHEAFKPLANLVDSGWVGVEIFFVISGFVIAFSAEGKSLRSFAVGRLGRLYPGAWICASITALVLLVAGEANPVGWLGSMILSPVGPWIDGAYWTLGVEIWFYTMVGLTLWAAGSDRLFGLGWGLAVASTGFWVIRLGLYAGGVHIDRYLGLWSDILLLQFGCFFALGISIWASTKPGGWTVPRVMLGLTSLTGCLIEVLAHSRSTAAENQTMMSTHPLMIWLVATAMMIFMTANNDRLHNRFGAQAKLIRTIGLATYPLYLVHTRVGMTAMTAIGRPWLALGIVVPAICVLAFLVARAEGLIRPAIMRLSATPKAESVPDRL